MRPPRGSHESPDVADLLADHSASLYPPAEQTATDHNSSPAVDNTASETLISQSFDSPSFSPTTTFLLDLPGPSSGQSVQPSPAHNLPSPRDSPLLNSLPPSLPRKAHDLTRASTPPSDLPPATAQPLEPGSPAPGAPTKSSLPHADPRRSRLSPTQPHGPRRADLRATTPARPPPLRASATSPTAWSGLKPATLRIPRDATPPSCGRRPPPALPWGVASGPALPLVPLSLQQHAPVP